MNATVARTPNVAEAVEYLDAAIVDILDSWSLREGRPSGDCLMSALTSIRAARDHLAPRTQGEVKP